MFESLLKGLAAKGHDVVVLSHFPQKNPITNYTDISIKGSLPEILNTFTLEYAINQRCVNLLYFVWNLNVKFCEKVYEHPQVQRLIRSDEKFDLVITESFGVDCFTAFAHKFQVPHISMTSSMTMPWSDDDFGNPSHPAYVPIFFLPHTDRMNFQQRLLNTLVWLGMKLGRYYFAEIPMQELAEKHFGHDIPSLREIARNTSLLFANSHFSLNVPRPMVPAVLEVAGLHIGVPKKLPKVILIYYYYTYCILASCYIRFTLNICSFVH
jgi:glucuronosyltransferase